jgi:hypothetical protein
MRPKIPDCPDCGAGEDYAVINYGEIDDDSHLPEQVKQGMTPFCCLNCGWSWFEYWPKGREEG